MPTASISFDDFMAALPTERQEPMRQVWQLVRAAMPAGYTEHISPKYLEFRAGQQMYVGLANQKGYMSLHLVPMYLRPVLQEQLAAVAPKLKMGKGCVNFKKVEELPQAALADIIGAIPLPEYVANLQAMRSASHKKG